MGRLRSWFAQRYKLVAWWGLCLGSVPFLGDYVLYSRSRSDLPTRVAIAKKEGKAFDARPPLARFVDLRKEDPKAVPIVTPSSLRDDPPSVGGRRVVPLAGVSLARTLDCNEGGEYLVFDSDEHGFNNPRGLYERGLDVMIVGGSLAHGSCVAPDASVGAFLRRRFPKTLNLSYGDNGPLMELATLEEFGPMLAPKRVVWFYDWTDLSDLVHERTSPILSEYLASGHVQGVPAMQAEIDAALRAVVERRLEAAQGRGSFDAAPSVLADVLLLRHVRAALRPSGGQAELPRMRQVLEQAKALVAGWGGTLYVAYAPYWGDFLPGARENPDRAPFLAMVREIGVPLVDLYPVLKAHPDPLSLYPFRILGHNNAAGYELMANAIAARIASDKP